MTTTRQDRIGAGACTALVVGALGAALFWGLLIRPPVTAVEDERSVFSLQSPPPPPTRIVPKRAPSRRAEGRAAPRNIRSQATEIVAPVPVVPIPVPPPVVVAPVAGTGAAPTQGAAPLPGPGTGAGGEGDGRGSGGYGDGDGGGGDDTPPRRIKGRIKDSDYPRDAADMGAGGTVSVRYYVNVDGRVSGCRVTRSSGNAALDATTCRLITERFRYDPSRDATGRPVRSIMVVDHDWEFTQEPPDDRRR